MITAANIELCPRWVREAFEQLTGAWPVGATVRHVNGWTGRITDDDPANRASLTGGVGAHCLLTGGLENAAVCVAHEVDGHPVTLWYRPEVLTLERGPRTRTRVVRHAGRVT